MQKNVRQPEVLKQIMEPNAEKCASTRSIETDDGAKCRKMCVN
ncbi:hypothetical protein [Heyndrickxia oleronia]|nr:hypothetical protein [Heyndrickxia oleronia]